MQLRGISKISGWSLLIVGGVDAVINASNMISISPQPLEMVAMGVLAVAIVFFKIEARLAGNRLLWFLAACVTFWSFLQFFLSIVAAGLAPLPGTEIKAENPIVLEARNQYDVAKAAVEALDTKQKGTGANFRTYSNDLAKQREALVADQTTKFEVYQKVLCNAQAQGKQYGLEVFGKIPQLLNRVGKTNAVEGFAIIIAMVIGCAIGFFIEAFMVHAANEALRIGDKRDEQEERLPEVDNRRTGTGQQPGDSADADELQPDSADKEWEDSAVYARGLGSNGSSPRITERMYVREAWPKDSVEIIQPEVVAANRGWDLEECKVLHNAVFGQLQFYNRNPLMPKLSRDQFLRQRRSPR